MSERKYTDEEFIKALEYCVVHTGCPDDCPLKQERKCYNIMTNKAYDLINRKNAEIESLEYSVRLQAEMLYEARAEATKEFAERLKANMCHGYLYLDIEEDLFRRDVDNLVAEMTEGK